MILYPEIQPTFLTLVRADPAIDLAVIAVFTQELILIYPITKSFLQKN